MELFNLDRIMRILDCSCSMGCLWCMIRVRSEWDLHRGLLLQVCSLLHEGDRVFWVRERENMLEEGNKGGGGMLGRGKVMDIMTRFLRGKNIR
jgi:hypothetical protein